MDDVAGRQRRFAMPPAATPARIAAKATMRKPRHRDIDAD
jgi:hypothetical protein